MIQKILLIVASFLIIALGQAASVPPFGICASTFGFALFFIAIQSFSAWNRFFIGMAFFALIQVVQLAWLISHPYSYIWGVYLSLALLLGFQFGFLAAFITKKQLESRFGAILLAASWVFVEWYRLYYFSGFTFNPIGLALATNKVTLQMASFFGIYGLSFWVFMTNCLVARAYLTRKIVLAAAVIILPLIYGILSLQYHDRQMAQYDLTHPKIHALLVSSKILPEEIEGSGTRSDLIGAAFKGWEKIVEALLAYKEQTFDFILFPEIVVPFAADAPLFSLQKVEELFKKLTPHSIPIVASEINQELYVSSSAIAQGLSTIFKTPFIIGLEGRDSFQDTTGKYTSTYFNSAFYILPNEQKMLRYDKRILLPMAESIPFDWAKPLAARYGLFDSFKKGNGPVIFQTNNHRISASICYEDTFSELIREDDQNGATILVNLTNDGWYPNSSLGIQHLEHGRLRSVENGRPLFRACNFGISGAMDCFGRDVLLIPFQTLTQSIQATPVEVSAYTVTTLYSRWGDAPVVLFAIVLLVVATVLRKW
ncbi:MAG: apolipoprotein N-acyltransferase [Chlamydiia bacterium]|nr:apolipoprotein N-acyltransferase [Chlamydiia bacterium]